MTTEELKQVKVCLDSRELRSGVPAHLEQMGATLQIEGNMPVADFVVSDRMGFERKTCSDFLQDWITSRELFPKLIDLKMAYSHPVLLLEGYTAELFELRGIDPQKVQACLYTIARMRIPLVETINAAGTARALYWFGNKEQNDEHRPISLHGKRSQLSRKGKLEYIISSFPDCGVGRQTAIDLLCHFGSVENVIKAGLWELMDVAGIGEPTAVKIRAILTDNYNQGD
ncbi:MAG: ERCC4 domain-containing protein [Ignavibacteria bacterium]|nr:ERCC4 domain-containing protein [Ignavibacteria bacterium]